MDDYRLIREAMRGFGEGLMIAFQNQKEKNPDLDMEKFSENLSNTINDAKESEEAPQVKTALKAPEAKKLSKKETQVETTVKTPVAKKELLSVATKGKQVTPVSENAPYLLNKPTVEKGKDGYYFYYTTDHKLFVRLSNEKIESRLSRTHAFYTNKIPVNKIRDASAKYYPEDAKRSTVSILTSRLNLSLRASEVSKYGYFTIMPRTYRQINNRDLAKETLVKMDDLSQTEQIKRVIASFMHSLAIVNNGEYFVSNINGLLTQMRSQVPEETKLGKVISHFKLYESFSGVISLHGMFRLSEKISKKIEKRLGTPIAPYLTKIDGLSNQQLSKLVTTFMNSKDKSTTPKATETKPEETKPMVIHAYQTLNGNPVESFSDIADASEWIKNTDKTDASLASIQNSIILANRNPWKVYGYYWDLPIPDDILPKETTALLGENKVSQFGIYTDAKRKTARQYFGNVDDAAKWLLKNNLAPVSASLATVRSKLLTAAKNNEKEYGAFWNNIDKRVTA